MNDKVIKSEIVDAMGTWVVYEDLTMEIIEPSEQWIARKLEMEEEAKTPPTLTEIELLKQENELLNMSVMELSNYAAEQDTKIQTQEDAIMELSMFIMGGN